MRKKFLSIMLSLGLGMAVVACGDSTVVTPSDNAQVASEDSSQNKELSECEINGHVFEDATCKAPKTCKICGETDGKALEHQWGLRTVETPKTCSVCGETEGTAISVKEQDIVIPSGIKMIQNFDNHYVFSKEDDYGNVEVAIYNYDGELEKSEVYAIDGNSYGYLCYPSEVNGKIYVSLYGIEKYAEYDTTAVVDMDGKIVWTADQDKWPGAWCYECFDNGGYMAVELYPGDGGDPVYINTETNEIVQKQPDLEEQKKVDEYDTEKWDVFEKDLNSGYYFVSKKDGSGWGFLDSDLNELAMYMDASNFTESGYALVSDDKEVYSIIDKDFNVVGEKVIEGVEVSYVLYTKNIIRIDKADGKNMHLCIIE